MTEPSLLRRVRLGFALTVLAGFAAALPGCSSGDVKKDDVIVDDSKSRTKAEVPPLPFTDVTTKAGIHFTHVNGAFGQKLLPETMGPGCAFLDYDGDGKQDLLLLNGRAWPGHEAGGSPPTTKLYRNRGDGTFEDVTTKAGLAVTLFGMGIAVGDYDNDGFPDLYLTAVGGSRLFKNVPAKEGGRAFSDVTARSGDLNRPSTWPEASGAALLKWSHDVEFPSSTAFLDYDRDGKLDLFVCHYVKWSPQYDLANGTTFAGIGRAYAPPRTFQGTHCRLYHNRGDGSFEDVTKKAGIEAFTELGKPLAKALGVMVCDADEDGWPDVMVANDTVRNLFFHNQGNGTFKEKGVAAGVAFAEGTARGAMGIDWGEYRPGQCALVIGNFANEPITFLRLDVPAQQLFSDVATLEGIAGPSRSPLTFGTFFFDVDLDGRLDLLTVNGHLEPEIQTIEPSQRYRQAPLLFWNTGTARAYEPARAKQVGKDFMHPLVGRGSAYADVDGNGTLDVVMTENGGDARLLRNDAGKGHHWVRFTLAGDGTRVNRSAIGARVVLTAGGQTQKREVVATRGYLSGSELPVTFGLGAATKVDRVEIHWPGRNVPVQVLTDVAVDRTHTVRVK